MYALVVFGLMVASFVGGIVHKHHHPVENNGTGPVNGRKQLVQAY